MDDHCVECRLYGSNYSYDEDGDIVSNCYGCPFEPYARGEEDDDTISRAAAIDAVNNMIRRKFGISADLGTSALEALPSAQPGWIPCKTALPEHDGEYLVTKKSFGWNCKEYIENDIARYEKKDGWHKADQVLAWQPLPTPYREGGQDEQN